MNVIICDDERLVRLTLRSMIEELRSNNYNLIDCKNGMELIKSVKDVQPEICFVDINMPFISGLEAIRQCKDDSPNTQWFILTGEAEFYLAKEAISLGVKDYLLKPCSLSDLEKSFILAENSFKKGECKIGQEAEQCNNPVNIQPTNPPEFIVHEVLKYINTNYMNDIGVNTISLIYDITPNYLSKIFHEKAGVKFTDYIAKIRVSEAKKLLSTKPYLSIKEISEMVGYNSPRHFAKQFLKFEGCYPSDFKI